MQQSLTLLRIDPATDQVTGKPVPVGEPLPAALAWGSDPTAIAAGPTGLWVLDFYRNLLFHLDSAQVPSGNLLGRDLDFDEDRSQIRTASGPRIMASLRNLVTILRLARATNIAAALRFHARRPSRPLRTIMKCQPTWPRPWLSGL